jgi:ornithine cyclodeaminase/alanine dehydrogenase-like protein (mu-crystallin family)
VIFIDAAAVERHLPFSRLIAAIEAGFAGSDYTAPLRTAHVMAEGPSGADSLLMMPCWARDGYLGVKLVTVMPGNAGSGHRTVNATYVLSSADSGLPLAVIDGEVLTTLRTAAASAVAARRLAAPEAARLLMVGTGGLCVNMIRAHAAVRPLQAIRIWGRNADKAREKASLLRDLAVEVVPVGDLGAAVRWADIVCCATTARAPVVRGEWLRSGQHLDLVGAYRPDMREVDDCAITKAAIFVDSHAGCVSEAGDLTQPMAKGLLSASDIRADLAELCQGRHPGRTHAEQITVFKSVGTAVVDLIAARVVFEGATARSSMRSVR